jgi:tight adherence protein C
MKSRIYPKKVLNRIQNKINLLGPTYKYTPLEYLNFRVFTSIILFVLIIIFSNHSYLYAPLFTLFYYIYFEHITLDNEIKKRKKKLENEAIFFFEVLNLTLESGRNLKAALSITSKNVDGELSKEFQKMLADIKLGKSFNESLRDTKERIPSEAINNVILNLTESNIYGSNITETLNTELDYLREKKLMGIKAEITKLPTKISVISVIFFIPIMLLIILAPVFIEFLTQ